MITKIKYTSYSTTITKCRVRDTFDVESTKRRSVPCAGKSSGTGGKISTKQLQYSNKKGINRIELKTKAKMPLLQLFPFKAYLINTGKIKSRLSIIFIKIRRSLAKCVLKYCVSESFANFITFKITLRLVITLHTF